LKYLVNRAAVDTVAVDQRTGPVVACDWIEFGTTHWNNDPKCAITVCQAKGTQVASVVVANGWAFEKSLSARHTFVDRDELQKSFDFVRSEPNIDVYRHRITGEELRFPQQFRLTGRARSCRPRQVRNRSRELAQSGCASNLAGMMRTLRAILLNTDSRRNSPFSKSAQRSSTGVASRRSLQTKVNRTSSVSSSRRLSTRPDHSDLGHGTSKASLT
jgi:hypothetical protein